MNRSKRRTAATAAAIALGLVGYGAVVASPAAAAPDVAAGSNVAGTGVGVARVANLSGGPTVPPAAAASAGHRHHTKALPARPSRGQRPAAPAVRATGAAANTSGSPAIVPLVAPGVVANFNGINQAAGCGGCQPSDVNAAVGTTQILESVNVTMRAMTKGGFTLCTRPLNTFLNTTDALTDPRVQYDNVNLRYSLVVTIKPASTTATPALWVAASQTNNACGAWNIYRVTFGGGSFPPGTLLDYPILGQDRNALLFSTDNRPPGGQNFTVFGIPKSAVYSGAGFSFTAFNTASFVAPATNGGIPMVSTTLSYFLGAVPGTGYRLYTLTNSGGPGAVLTLRATISAPFSAPTRQVNQPGTTVTLDPLDGRIAWSPVLASGNFLWFAHGIDFGGFPTVRYGAINVVSNTSGGMALAFRSGTSDDFNPSISVGNNPGGGGWIFVNWAFTDTSAGIATSATVDMVTPGGGIPNLIGTGAVLVNGSSTSQFRFGDYSSVAIDPSNANGSCAVTGQQFFVSGGTWATRIGRVGTC
jgi:hypothetical protein